MSAWDKIKDVVGSVAPMAGSMLASALGVDNTPDAVAAAIKSDPQAL